MTDYDLMNTGILGVGMDPYILPESQPSLPYDELDDVESQDIDRERIEEQMRLASMEQYPPADEKGNLFQQGLDYAMNMKPVRGLTSAYNVAKGNVMMPALGMMGMIANQRNPLNPNSANYNPELQGQIDMLRSSGILGGGDPSGPYRITSGPLAGKNLVSGWGTNDYNAMLQKRIDYFRKRKTRTTLQNKKMHEAIAEQERIEKQRQEAAAAAKQRAEGLAGLTTQGGGQGIASAGVASGRVDPSGMGGGSRQAQSSGAQDTGRTDSGWGWAEGGLAGLWQR